jgi:hypothetical protein
MSCTTPSRRGHRRRCAPAVAALSLCLGLLTSPGPAAAGDRHAGYYYPEPDEIEIYETDIQTMPQASRAMRIGFVTGLTNQIFQNPYPPQAAIFAKGAEAEKLIIVALADGRIDTLYRARAQLANMTSLARLLPGVQELGVRDEFNFFDLIKLLGFTQLTISDGRDFAHQVLMQ